MPTNTAYNPQKRTDFEKNKLNKDAQGVQATITNQGASNIDLTLTDDELLLGGFLLANPPNQGDWVNFQVVAPGGVVVAQYVSNWFLDPTVTKQDTPNSDFPAKIPAGFTLRLVYHATGGLGLGGLLSQSVWVAVLYDMQKVLV